MKRSHTFGLALAGAVTVVAGPVLVLPLLTLAAGGPDTTPCASDPASDGGSPTIQGAATLDAADLAAWWDDEIGRQPARLGRPIDTVIQLYLTEGRAEGIRGDLAFAQAMHETGRFTNADTARNNFAGIGTFDGQPTGRVFPTVATGVRAHIQLLKKFAAGNDVPLANPDVAPDAGARATTWQQLAGTWATDPDYWTAISRIYRQMLDHAGQPSPDGTTHDCPAPTAVGPDDLEGTPGNVPLAAVDGITGGVHAAIAQQVRDLLDAAAADGLRLTGSGYRSPERQIELRRAHCGTSRHAVYEMPASQCSPPTARPGSSMHELGLAIDFRNCANRSTACFQWLAANASDFSLFNLPSEPWHWSTNGS